jgi:2-polyprenyl-6-methoxyphenol hydroxylase-like FAD-dependent oxidoreductase
MVLAHAQTWHRRQQGGWSIHADTRCLKARTYELPVGADGLYSRVRQTVFPDASQPLFTGWGSWRAPVRRPPGRHRFWLNAGKSSGLRFRMKLPS